jgi:hypothetical protein
MKGLGILESNPVYVMLGGVGFILAMIGMYALVIFGWYYLVETYQKVYEKKFIMWRFYDVFLFLACFILVSITFGKIQAGMDNVALLEEAKHNVEIYNNAEKMLEVKNTNITQYTTERTQTYQKGLYQFTYLELLIRLIVAYSLFRIGCKVRPYECD